VSECSFENRIAEMQKEINALFVDYKRLKISLDIEKKERTSADDAIFKRFGGCLNGYVALCEKTICHAVGQGLYVCPFHDQKVETFGIERALELMKEGKAVYRLCDPDRWLIMRESNLNKALRMACDSIKERLVIMDSLRCHVRLTVEELMAKDWRLANAKN